MMPDDKAEQLPQREDLEKLITKTIGEITRTDAFSDPRHPSHYTAENLVNDLTAFKTTVPKLKFVGALIEHHQNSGDAQH